MGNNPGKIVHGFDLKGRAKSKVLPRSVVSPPQPGLGLYIRVLYDDQWTFVAGTSCRYAGSGAISAVADDTADGDVGIIERVKRYSPETTNVLVFDSVFGVRKNRRVYPHEVFARYHFLGTWIRNKPRWRYYLPL